MDYEIKYHKYKTKYLNLQQKLKKEQIQSGGKIFNKKQILYIVATISQAKLKKTTKEITDTILGKNIKPYRAPHITLFNLIINANNTDNKIFHTEKFYNQIKNIYEQTMINRSDPMILKAKPYPKDFTFPGYRPRYFLKNYKPLDRQKILDFRERVFDLIKTFLGKAKIKEFYEKNGAKYYVYSYKGKELFAESAYYDKWRPHLNFLNDFDIQKHNPRLYKKINKYYSGKEKTDVLVNEIDHIPQEIFEEINMASEMRNLTYAIDHLLQKTF